MSIEVQNVSKRFGDFVVLDDVSLSFQQGELTALLGPSGCGKTSLLRVIAGLQQPDFGRVFLDGQDSSDQHIRERQVGFVFQHYALFKHMTVFENVAFGLRVKSRATRPSKEAIRQKVMELLHLVQLDWIADRYPSELSGGQRQRIALARALAVEPKVLLLDEPFGALDAKVRKELRRWLRRLHDELHVTSIFVTHDQEEALEVADQIVLMNHGRVEQTGTPYEVYQKPASPFVYEFLGDVNVLIQPDGTHVYVRPHDIRIEKYEPGKTQDHALHANQETNTAPDATPYAKHDEARHATRPEACYVARLRRVVNLAAITRLELDLEDSPHKSLEVVLPIQHYQSLAAKEGDYVLATLLHQHIFESALPIEQKTL